MNQAVIKWLQSLGHEVIILLTGNRLAGPLEYYPLAEAAGPHIKRLGRCILPASPKSAAFILARAALRRLPAGLGHTVRSHRLRADAVLGGFISKADADWCAAYIARRNITTVLVDTIFRAALLTRPELSGANTILIAHDVFHRRHAALRSAGYRILPESLTAAAEADLLRPARHIAAIQPDEAAALKQLCPSANVFVTAMPAALRPPPPAPARDSRHLVFLGSASLPNLDGMRWFLAEIWPLLSGHGITLDLLGDCGPALRASRHRSTDHVTIHGRVADPAALLHRASLAIAPLRVGSGLKIKLLDYARHGLTTVATPASLQGFAPDPASPFMEASTPSAFAAAILQALAAPPDPARALAYVTRHYGAEASFHALTTALQYSPAAARPNNPNPINQKPN